MVLDWEGGGSGASWMIGYIATLCRRLSGMEGFQSLSGEVVINGGQVASGRIDDLLAFSCDGLVCK